MTDDADDTSSATDAKDLFASAFGGESGTRYRINRAIAEHFPNRFILKMKDAFDLEEYALGNASDCEIKKRNTPPWDVDTSWRRVNGLTHNTATAIFDVNWRGQDVIVAIATWPEMYQTRSYSWVISKDDSHDQRQLVARFANEVCAFCNEPRQSVLAFRGGCWRKDREIYKAIQSASFDDLILAGEMSREIRDDFTSFLSAKEEYARYGVPWKRGVLFLGPPGNGKTHCLRATIKLLGVTCLYVQSFKARYETDDANIAAVFDRAREVTPCCLVFEDLDAMITSENRSTFLNQLDGFANASGMLTLATTNHPDKLDPAILERPSRFDRKYHFSLPASSERARYIASWRERLEPSMRINDVQIKSLVQNTDGFSFAYLKELFLSSMIRWIKSRESGGMFALLETQLQILREQMKTDPEPTPNSTVTPRTERHPFDD